MRLLRYGAPGREKPGLADADGNVRDLSKIITQVDDAMLSPRNLAALPLGRWSRPSSIWVSISWSSDFLSG